MKSINNFLILFFILFFFCFKLKTLTLSTKLCNISVFMRVLSTAVYFASTAKATATKNKYTQKCSDNNNRTTNTHNIILGIFKAWYICLRCLPVYHRINFTFCVLFLFLFPNFFLQTRRTTTTFFCVLNIPSSLNKNIIVYFLCWIPLFQFTVQFICCLRCVSFFHSIAFVIEEFTSLIKHL